MLVESDLAQRLDEITAHQESNSEDVPLNDISDYLISISSPDEEGFQAVAIHHKEPLRIPQRVRIVFAVKKTDDGIALKSNRSGYDTNQSVVLAVFKNSSHQSQYMVEYGMDHDKPDEARIVNVIDRSGPRNAAIIGTVTGGNREKIIAAQGFPEKISLSQTLKMLITGKNPAGNPISESDIFLNPLVPSTQPIATPV